MAVRLELKAMEPAGWLHLFKENTDDLSKAVNVISSLDCLFLSHSLT